MSTSTSGRSSTAKLEYARRHIRQLYEISKLLVRFESVEQTVPAVLALATGVLHVRLAVLMEGQGGCPLQSVWRTSSVTHDELEAATAAARASYEYLVGGPRLDATPAGVDLAAAVELEAMTGAEVDGRERRWILPLAVDRRTVFGVLYVQCRDSLDEVDLAFVSAVANQLAVALDRHYARRAEVALRERAEALALSEQAARAREHAAVVARDALILVASHELRGPLGGLAMQLALLMRNEKRTDEDLRRRLDGAKRQVTRMSKLVAELLDVSRVTAGRLDLSLEAVDLSAVVGDVAERSAHDLERSGCPLELRADRPVVGRWDRSRLDQVVTNLLSNAIKYGDGEPIVVAVELDGERARLRVSDGGVGLVPADQARIFEPFERAVASGHRASGLGLGLWIVRQIVVAMGGTIHVASQPGAGSVFTVELPVAGPVAARP